MGENYLEKVYSGLLGKMMGIILGAPVEPTVWSYEKIQSTYGEIKNYLVNYKNFAADDDMNGPVFFLKALDFKKDNSKLSPEDVGKAWLNYSREGVGMFWWGGYGRSTEHTAFLNLKNGISAPHSGSIEQNGEIMAEQIGGQIFIDTWGLVFPGNPEQAAEYARIAASVSHDGNGLYGAMFVAGCIAQAFKDNDIKNIVKKGLSLIPEKSEYSRVSRAVIEFHENNPLDFRACRKFLENNFGYDKYPGICHIIPNAGIIILSLLYGEGKLDRSIEIATMCGWDTDCNAGNVGSILGVMNGYSGLDERYRKMINDVFITSSISGSLNIIDLPTLTKEVAAYGYQLKGLGVPDEIKKIVENLREINFDFKIQGSTHGFRSSEPIKFPVKAVDYHGENVLQVVINRAHRGDEAKIFYKPFYRREDFDDERYSPVFSPKVFSGQKFKIKLQFEKWNGGDGGDLGIATYVRLSDSKEIIKSGYKFYEENKWIDIEGVVPDTKGETIDEIGIILESFTREKKKHLGRVLLKEFKVFGKGELNIEFNKQKMEFGSILPFSHNRGFWNLNKGRMEVTSLEETQAFTGHFYSNDVKIKTNIRPLNGENHYLVFRSQGSELGYYFGFNGKNRVALIRKEFGKKILKEIEFIWEIGKDYIFEAEIIGDYFILKINGQDIIFYRDDTFKHGMTGFALMKSGRASMEYLRIKEL